MSEARKPKTAPRVVHAAVEFVAAPAVPKRHRTRWILGDPDADAVEQEVEEHVRGRRGKDAKPTAERKAKDVERFELLAKAVAKVPEIRPRKLYVDKRDGSIGETTTRDFGDKLLEREAIANETADGVRPMVVLCAVCRCVVEVPKKGGLVPRTCTKHSKKKLCPRGCGATVYYKTQCCGACRTPDERLGTARKLSDSLRKSHAKKTPEQRNDVLRKARAAMTPEKRSDVARKMNAALTPEKRREALRKTHAALTPEKRGESLRMWLAGLTPEERGEVARRRGDSMRKVSAAITQEQRSVRTRNAMASMTPEQRREMARKMNVGRTQESRSEAGRKAAETLRAKKAAEKAGEQ